MAPVSLFRTGYVPDPLEPGTLRLHFCLNVQTAVAGFTYLCLRTELFARAFGCWCLFDSAWTVSAGFF